MWCCLCALCIHVCEGVFYSTCIYTAKSDPCLGAVGCVPLCIQSKERYILSIAVQLNRCAPCMHCIETCTLYRLVSLWCYSMPVPFQGSLSVCILLSHIMHPFCLCTDWINLRAGVCNEDRERLTLAAPTQPSSIPPGVYRSTLHVHVHV